MKKVNTQNLIIGFGKAGKTLAADLAKNGQKVILAEADDKMYGGTCINIGCIPSKKLLTEAEKLPKNDHNNCAFREIMERKNQLISALRKANYDKLDTIENVKIINAKAKFLAPKTVLLSGKDEDIEVFAERIFINTGASPAKLNIPGSQGSRIYDSTGFLNLDFLPKRIVIVGGGYISLEFATIYNALGSEVIILEAGEVFLAREDRDIAEEIYKTLTNRGIKILLNVQTNEFKETEKETTVFTSKGNFSTDAVLVAIGRRPNTYDLDLSKAGINTDQRGFIIVDDKLKASDNIWAMGDVAGSPQFTYISLDDYRIVRDQILGDGKRCRSDRKNIATSVFTFPPLSQVGMTETQAEKSGKEFIVKRMPATSIPKAKILGQTEGILKAIIDKSNGQILGATLFCAESHEIINLIKMAMDNGIPADYIKNQIFTHPTISEALNDLFS
ncbi:FAD-dependent oxidoreductase [Riemerella columbipharyngis]|uniref:Pyruvate/2-oxoglutarate dehydrogenase complex, dihydrolipoamide dehydrogenase (E3) component n=1 Tax=Riemerella columbipharyngis TaxID=1071918 RepID=A0A1G7B3L8_9FLAO|nr:FAD-dependent oxidoreductase [Riemerella columbipharyngis]SDE21621.1 Pyruvate/2-oxoglutarate dehydrogenase complex, dihydrolipoamide dehydrogenase (E3) component [Riemerella columbipharyngis]